MAGVGSWPVVGRDEECDATVSRLRRGVGTVLVGGAGTGKSTLAAEVSDRLTAEGWSTTLVLCVGGAALSSRSLDELAGVGRRSLVVVEDAHRLDRDAADGVWRLAHDPDVSLLVTVRSGEITPDPVARLWTSGRCERSELGPLGVGEVLTVLEQVLGGDVEDRLAWTLAQRSQGNPLFLRELVTAGRRDGAIARDRQVWKQVGALPVGAGVTELLRASLSGLGLPDRTTCEYVALGQPVTLPVGEALLDVDLLEALEGRGLVRVQTSIDGPVITMAHPLHAEVLLSELPPLRSRRLRRDLVRAIGSVRGPSAAEVVRSALWRLELDEPVDEAELLAAARSARATAGPTAELLARAAADGGSAEATVTLAEIVLMRGRIAEADRLLDDLAATARPTPLPEALAQRVAATRALGRTRLGEIQEAAALVAGPHVPAGSLHMQALHAQALMLDGDLDRSTALAGPVFHDPGADAAAKTLAAFVLVASAGYAGERAPSEEWLQAELAHADTLRAAAPYDVATLEATAALAAARAGRLHDAEVIAGRMHRSAMAAGDEWLHPRVAAASGAIALQRGQVRTATRHFRIMVSSSNDFDGRFLRYSLSFLARAAALAGLADEARAALADVPPEAPSFPVLQTDWDMAEAAVLAAGGAWTAAARVALTAARVAAARGAWRLALAAAHDAVRYTGDPGAAEIVVAAADQLRAPLPAALARHAHARTTNDGPALRQAGEDLAAVGAVLHAAEARYAAARAFRDAGRPDEAVREQAHALALHARCENADIAWVASFPATDLTPRERQVALLAAGGRQDQHIATQLGISPRTVQVHLHRAYHKLGITNRRQLPGALTPR
ncbi:LuxR family transcriptional regulator [Rhodococcus aerolatus]